MILPARLQGHHSFCKTETKTPALATLSVLSPLWCCTLLQRFELLGDHLHFSQVWAWFCRNTMLRVMPHQVFSKIINGVKSGWFLVWHKHMVSFHFHYQIFYSWHYCREEVVEQIDASIECLLLFTVPLPCQPVPGFSPPHLCFFCLLCLNQPHLFLLQTQTPLLYLFMKTLLPWSVITRTWQFISPLIASHLCCSPILMSKCKILQICRLGWFFWLSSHTSITVTQKKKSSCYIMPKDAAVP